MKRPDSKVAEEDQEGLLSRWSRRKRHALSEAESADADESGQPAVPLLTDADMPALDSLTQESDFSGFLSPQVSEELRRLALRKLFHSPLCNTRDGLDDYDDDFTSFAKLGDLITSDMRHRMEQEARRLAESAEQDGREGAQLGADDGRPDHQGTLQQAAGVAPQPEVTDMNKQDRADRAAGEAALEALGELNPRPTSLVEFSSRGRVLVLGRADAWSAANRMQPPLQPLAVSRTPRPDTLARLPGHEISATTELNLDGHLGAFVLRIEPADGEPSRLEADLVLDLGEPSLISGRVPPPGYFSVDIAPERLDPVLQQLSDMVGVFEKPVYFAYDPDICAHQRNGVTACTRCLDACPTEAIASIGDRVEVDPNLCQGLGSCATACPSGAIRYSYPAPGDALGMMRTLLQAYRDAGGQRPRLLVHDAEQGAEWARQVQGRLPGSVIPLQVEDIASLGLEAWLCALAFGATDLTLLLPPGAPAKVSKLLDEQIGVCTALLEGLGFAASRVRALGPESPDALPAVFHGTPHDPVAPATFALSDEKRAMAFWALDHLQAHAPAVRPVINLPVGAPFGAAEVSEQACTLCMSCVGACPGHALQDGYDKPELRFVEANCLQCGMCTRTCPEDAIWITPRFLFDSEARRRPRVLYQEPAFECVSCGKPFATRSVINKMMARLEGHYMFQDQRARRRLQMCEDCRVVDIAQDPDAMGAGLRLHGHQ